MKQLFSLIILFFALNSIVYGQVETHHYKKGEAPNLRRSNSKSVPVKRIPAFDIEKVKQEHEKIDAMTGLCHFGKGFDVSYTLSDGLWEESEGGRLWTMSFESSEALSLNFVFNDFFLPEGAELYVTNDDGTIVFGPVTHEALHSNGHYLTDIIRGSRATISLFEPSECAGQSTLTIKRVVHGYRSDQASKTRSQMSYNDSPDVACYPDYEEVADGVGLLYTSDGEADVSCSLVMTTDYSFKPYILTTYFYIDYNNDSIISEQEKYEAENCMVKFRCRYETCNGINIVTSYTYNQSYFRSAYRDGGMGLLELRSSLKNNPNLTWMGWSRYATPTHLQGATLFHANDKTLRIALCDCYYSLETIAGINCTKIYHYVGNPFDYCAGAPFLNSYKRVFAITIAGVHGIVEDDWEYHYTLVKPLFETWYGGLTDSTGLAHWLDPEGKNWSAMNSSRVMDIVGLYHIISSRSYYIKNLPSDVTVTWSLSDSYYNQNCLQQNYPESNQCTITRDAEDDMTNAILTATLRRGGTILCTFRKAVKACDGFEGTYYNGITTKDINLPSPLEARPGITMRITSPYLIGATLTQTGGNLTPDYMSFNSTHDVLYIGIPSSPQGAIVLGVSCSNGASYTLPVTNTLSSSLLSVNPSLNQLEISLTPTPELEDLSSLGISYSHTMEKKYDANNSDEWQIEIYNLETGIRMVNSEVAGSKYTIDTSGWSSGVYIVRAIIGDEVLNEKVYIK